MLLARRSTGFLLGLFLFGLGLQLGFTKTYDRSFCTGITMPETRLCDDNLPVIEIVEVSQYDFAEEEYPGRPCVYSGRDCGRPIYHDTQLYKDVITHCDGQRTCGGFYITGLTICAGRQADYMNISVRCRRNETATTAETSEQTSTPSTTTPTSVTSGILTYGDPRRPKIELYTGVAVGVVVAVILVMVVIVVCVKRKKRGTWSKPIDTNDGDTPADHQTDGEQKSSRLHTPGEAGIALEEIVTDNNADETSPEQPAPDRMTADIPAVRQHGPDLAEKDSPVGSNPGQEDTMHLATPTADTQEAW